MTRETPADVRRNQVVSSLIPALDLRPFIDGGFRDPVSSAELTDLDPTTERTLAVLPTAGPRDVDAAVGAARTAFDEGPWPRMTAQERADTLERFAALIERDAERLSLLEATDTGKRLAGVRGWDVPQSLEVYRYYARAALEREPSTQPDVGTARVVVCAVPVGVCAAITPWNFPFACISWKIAPALAAGCTVVVKPPERAPLSAQALAALATEAGFPPGVFNVVTGVGDVAGRALAADPRVDKITFTGSVDTARSIVAGSTSRMPRLTLELGGKGANVVMADCDLDAAVAGTIDAMFDVAGQNCCAGSRTYVQRDIYEDFLARLVTAAESRRLGDPLDEATQQGPQIDRQHFERIDGYVKGALKEGASCATGGGGADLGGLFYAPTILTGATRGMRITREEVFGPVGCIYPVDGPDDAIAAANDTDYGLSTSVWTSDESFADRFIREVRVGTCWVNCFGYFAIEVPWGGVKLSGQGRELGLSALDEFLDAKAVFRI
ncbi:aldehyde dehydrogenase family protein [Wenjunlia tyrosinilytica]|uniref:Phenylacetaldehyde dehydrogenase n=1 Tax=Wenjunlia tyrosinilytica TaxID=1544741 RepID=A0A917ZYU8_9ACTN|nr:aldehyde dehydrogenase family protein [Wenjunlia tyrosinilytica]GGO99668.1 phenylacetaldehyde dehydrogenase [Wenjunlia tyrosinilytica]